MDKDQILAKWIAGEISDAELKTLVSREEYADFIKLRKGISLYEMTRKPLPENLYKNIQKARKSSKTFQMFKMIGAVAATILLLLGVNHFISPNMVSVSTAYGEQQEIILPDGSTVLLDAKSTLRYNKDKWSAKKEVNLDGNAYFSVKKGSDFTVSTQNGKIVALGTKFTVNSIDDYLNVKCFEGKIKVITDIESVLVPYETFQKIGKHTEKSVVKYHQPLWLSGEIRFRSTPLKYVLTAIEKQYGIHFIKKNIDDNKLFSGSFKHDNLALTLKVVLNASNIKVKKKDAHTYVLTKP